MIIVRDERLIKRNAQIGKYGGIVAIAILGIGVYINIQYPEEMVYSLIALIVGFVLSQIGIFYANRFGRSPRPDEELDNALKGLDDQYALYHYQTPVSHLLVGPAGVWILFPYLLKGKVIYDDKKERWKKIGGNLYMRVFAQDSIGNPTGDVSSATKRIQKELSKISDFEIPQIKTALVFTNEYAEVDADNAPLPTIHAGKLKKLIRKEAKGDSPLPTQALKTIQDFLGLSSKK